jgi:uncharacterized protein YneF (UPF0154 family)
MKGVIVQVGEPKSIVLFNNGKIQAIPTPPNCHVGMVITVKYSNLLRILLIVFAAVLLIALGIFIGAKLRNPDMPAPENPQRGHRHMRMMQLDR